MIVERLVEKLSIRSSFLKLILGSTLIALIIALGMTGKDLRILNPKIVKYFQKIFIFWQEFEVWCFHQSSNLTSVETKWCHEFAEES